MTWWTLTITKNALTDEDREHIARLIEDGFTEGELNDTEGSCHHEYAHGECIKCRIALEGDDDE